jgi:hypothetical protein
LLFYRDLYVSFFIKNNPYSFDNQINNPYPIRFPIANTIFSINHSVLMLCIIITRNKILAGINKDKNELLVFSGKKYFDLGSKPMLDALATHLPSIEKAYTEHAAIKDGGKLEKIPTAVAFAVGNARKDGSAYAPADVVSFFNQEAQARFDLYYAEHLPLSFVRGVNGSTKLASESCIVLEAIDDHLNLCYCNIPPAKLNGKAQGSDDFRYISYKEIGQEAAVQNFTKEVINEFSKAGLTLDGKSKQQLATQVSQQARKPVRDHTFSLNRSQGKVSIKAELNLSARQQEEILAANVPSLKERLSREQVDALGIKKVVLLGDYLQNQVLQDFLVKDLRLGNRVMATQRNGWDGDYLAIVKGIGHTAHEVAKVKKEEERKRREAEARRQALEREKRLKAERERVLTEIRQTCVDSAQQEAYEKKFVAQGAKLNMPAEVIKWNIQEALSSASLLQDARVASPAYANAVTLSSSLPVSRGEKEGNQLPRLEDIFDVKGVLIDPEFSTKKVHLKGSSANKVLRLLPAKQQMDSDALSRFEQLYNKELVYYQELSEIKDAAEGKYYYRDFIPRNSLKDYMKKLGMDKKDAFSRLSSKEIKFILRIFDEVRNLPVPHANLSEFNILVLQEGLLKRTTEIKFVGFTSQDCSISEMEEKLHGIFSSLMKPQVYAELRKNLKI